MATEPKTLTDEIDGRVDRRLAQLQDSLELKLIKQTDALFKDRFDRATKLLGWSATVAAITLTAFGIKTFFDIRNLAQTTAISEVKKTLSIDDPNSDFRRDVDTTVARSLINSYFLALNRDKDKVFAPGLQISQADFRRLIDFISDKRTALKDFSDASQVLLSSQITSQNEEVTGILLGLARANDDKFKWMKDQPEKRAVIFRTTTNDKLISSAEELLSEKIDHVLLVEAIRYLGRNNDKQSAKRIEPFVSNGDKNVSRSALVALAQTAPDSKALTSFLFPNDPKNLVSSAQALSLAMILAAPPGRDPFDIDPDAALRIQIASKVVERTIDNGNIFRLTRNFASRDGNATPASTLNLASMGNQSFSVVIPSDIINGEAVQVLRAVLKDWGDDVNRLAKTVRALCLDEDGRCRGVIRIDLSKGAKIVLDSNITLDNSNAPTGVTVRASGPAPDADLLATWTDPLAVSKNAKLTKVLNTGGALFDVAATRALASDPDADWWR